MFLIIGLIESVWENKDAAPQKKGLGTISQLRVLSVICFLGVIVLIYVFLVHCVGVLTICVIESVNNVNNNDNCTERFPRDISQLPARLPRI